MNNTHQNFDEIINNIYHIYNSFLYGRTSKQNLLYQINKIDKIYSGNKNIFKYNNDDNNIICFIKNEYTYINEINNYFLLQDFLGNIMPSYKIVDNQRRIILMEKFNYPFIDFDKYLQDNNRNLNENLYNILKKFLNILHENNIYLQDFKPSNLIYNINFNINNTEYVDTLNNLTDTNNKNFPFRLIDFDSFIIKPVNYSIEIFRKTGTEGYISPIILIIQNSPEIFENLKEDLIKRILETNDLFALEIIKNFNEIKNMYYIHILKILFKEKYPNTGIVSEYKYLLEIDYKYLETDESDSIRIQKEIISNLDLVDIYYKLIENFLIDIRPPKKLKHK